jgi:hypothetical protein
VRGVCVAITVGLAAALCACARERPAPPPEDEPTPAASLRPLTSRDASSLPDRPAPADRTAPAGSLPPGHPPPLDGGASAAPPSAGESVAGTIAVAPALRERARGGVLFVIARAGADRQIVAVRREDGVAFPFAFRVSAADAMVGGTSFKGPLEITARLSKSGDATAAKGDLEGVAKDVAVGARDIKITLDRVRE